MALKINIDKHESIHTEYKLQNRVLDWALLYHSFFGKVMKGKFVCEYL